MDSPLTPALILLRKTNPKAHFNGLVNYAEALMGRVAPVSLPVGLDIILTKACNLRCTFCVSYGSLKGERWMSFDLYEQIARELFPTALNLFICSGGEPLLYSRIRDALRLARDSRTLVTMTSNGMLLNEETARWMVADQSLHELCISFDGARKETLERIRRGARYEKILGNLEYLSGLRERSRVSYPRLWFRYVVMRSNIEELPEIFGICAKYGLYKVVVKYLNVSNDIEFDESLFNHPDLAEQVFAEARRRAKESRIQLDLPPLPGRDNRAKKCLSPWQFCQIDTDGSVRFCYHSWCQRIGFFDNGFESVWRGPHYQKIRATVNSKKPYFPYCNYCDVRCGFDEESSHNQKLHADSYVIPGMEDLQISFNERFDENISSFKERDANR
ncbi:MAG: radical SAM protein [Deltaproteobacteria bacterium]